MKLELPTLQALKEIPDYMKEMWRYTGLLTEALGKILNGGIVMRDNVSFYQYSGSVPDGVEVKLQHGLKRKPSTVNLVSGRVQWMKVLGMDENTVTLFFSLMSTYADGAYQSSRNILSPEMVSESAKYFLVGDEVKIDGKTNEIVKIAHPYFTLKQGVVDRGRGLEMTLAKEKIILNVM